MLATGRTPSRQILRQETRAADPGEAAALRLAAGALVQVVEGLSLADGTPLAKFRAIFPVARFPDLLAAMSRHGSVTAALAACGLSDYTRQESRLTAKHADPVLALALQVAPGAPVLRSVAVNVDAAGVAVEHGTTWFAGDRVSLVLAD